MTIIRRFNFTADEEISAIAVDDISKFLWIAYKQNASGNCVLKKVSVFSPNQTYVSVDIAVDEITAIEISGTYIYLVYDNDTYIGARYSLTQPLTTSTQFALPAGITERANAIIVDGTDLYYLIPGEASGTNSKIVKMTTSGTFDETIDLSTVNDASSFTIDTNDNLWVVTDTVPTDLVRVYDPGSGYIYTVTTMT